MLLETSQVCAVLLNLTGDILYRFVNRSTSTKEFGQLIGDFEKPHINLVINPGRHC